MATREEVLLKFKELYPQYKEVPDNDLATALSTKYPQYKDALSTPAFTTGTSNPATDLGGIGEPVTDPAIRKRIAAERLVARERAAGFRPGDLLLREEAQQLANQARMSLGDIGDANVVSTSQFAPTTQGDILKSLVQLRGFGSGVGFQVPGALGKIIEDLTLNEAQKKVLGSRSMAEKAPEYDASGNLVGSFFPSGLIANRVVAAEAPLSERLLAGAQTGLPIGLTQGVASTVERGGLNTNLQDIINNASTGTAAGTVFGGLTSGLLGLPGAIKGTATRKQGALNDTIAKAQQDFEDATQKKIFFEDQLTRDVDEATIKRHRAALQVAQEKEQNALGELIKQEQLLAAQQSAQKSQTQAFTTSQELEPKIELLNQASKESPDLVGSITAGRGPAKQPSEFGSGVTSSIESEYQAAKKLTNEDYDAVKAVLPEEQPKLDADNLYQAVSSLKSEQGQGFSSLVDKQLNSVLSEASAAGKTKSLPPDVQKVFDASTPENQANILAAYPQAAQKKPKYTWDELQARFRQINNSLHQAVKNEDGESIRAFSSLRDAISKDMDAYAQSSGTEAKTLFDAANANYVAREEKFGTSRIQPLLSDQIREKPNLLVDRIITGNNAPVVNNLKQILPPDQFRDVQSQYVNYLFSPSKGVSFDPSHFVKQFEKVNDETLVAAFGNDGLRALKRLHEVSQGAEAASQLQKVVDEANSTAQKATENFQKAKTKSQEDKILSSFKSDAAKQLDEVDAQLQKIKDQSNDANTLQKIKSLERDITDARKALDKAKNPAQLSWPSRIVLASGSLMAGYASDHPVLGILSASAAFSSGERVGRNIVTPIGMQLLERAANSKADSKAMREFTDYLTSTSSRVETESLQSLIDEANKKNKKTIPSAR